MKNKSVLNGNDWFEPLEYAPDNKIVEVLEADESDINLKEFGYDSDRFNTESFSIWADL